MFQVFKKFKRSFDFLKRKPDILKRMAKLPPKASSSPSDSRQALLTAARRVFADRGFEGATVKDLADEAGVNVSLVSYYFGGKDGLYRECLLNFAEQRWQAIVRILKPAESPEEFRTRLQLLAEEIAEVHVHEPDLCRIVHRDVQNLAPAAVEVFKGGFFKIFETLVAFIKSAEKKGITRHLKDHESTAGLVMGSLMHQLQAEPHRKIIGLPSIQDAKYRTSLLAQWLEFTYNGLANHNQGEQEKK